MLTCGEHRSSKIEFVCIDNECESKLLCNLCCQYSIEKHNFLGDFCNGIPNHFSMEQISQFIHGTSLEKKLSLFNVKKIQPEEEFSQEYVQKLSEQLDEFSNQLQQILREAKRDVVQKYQKQIDESFDKHALNLIDYQKRGCQLVLNQIIKGNTKHTNENLFKLHTGQFEVSFARKSLCDSYYDIKNQLQKIVDQCSAYVKKTISSMIILSEKAVEDKSKKVIQYLMDANSENKESKDLNFLKKRQNIQVRLLNTENSIKEQQIQSPSQNSTAMNSLLNTITPGKSPRYNQITFKQNSDVSNIADNNNNLYFSPQNKARKDNEFFSSGFIQSARMSYNNQSPYSKGSNNFLLKDNLFSNQKERSITQVGKVAPKSAFNETMKLQQSNSVESIHNHKQKLQFVEHSMNSAKENSQENLIQDHQFEKQQYSNESISDDESKKDDTFNNTSKKRGESLHSSVQQNLMNPNLLSQKIQKDDAYNVVNLSSSLFIVTSINSEQLHTYYISEDNKICLKNITNIGSLKSIQKTLTSGLFFQFGPSKTPKQDHINIIKIQQLSDNGRPVEIIEMRDMHKEQLIQIIPLQEYCRSIQNENLIDLTENQSKGAINVLQFTGIFAQTNGLTTIKVWEIQLKNGEVKNSQIKCLNSFQLETGQEKYNYISLTNNSFLAYTQNCISKISYFPCSEQESVLSHQKFKHHIKKRVFKFECIKNEIDNINCVSLVGQDKLLICTKKSILYLLDLESLDVISITDFSVQCNLTQKVEITKCECPSISDESDYSNANIVRLVARYCQSEYKIYLYNVKNQENLMETPYIFSPVLFCFQAKAMASSQSNSKYKILNSNQAPKHSNEVTLIVFEQNQPIKRQSLIKPENKVRSITLNKVQEQQNHQNYNEQSSYTLINFYKPMNQISKQIARVESEQVLNKKISLSKTYSNNQLKLVKQ